MYLGIIEAIQFRCNPGYFGEACEFRDSKSNLVFDLLRKRQILTIFHSHFSSNCEHFK